MISFQAKELFLAIIFRWTLGGFLVHCDSGWANGAMRNCFLYCGMHFINLSPPKCIGGTERR